MSICEKLRNSGDKNGVCHVLTLLVEVICCCRWNIFCDQSPSGQLSSLAQGICYRCCPLQLQLTHTGLWSGAHSAKVWLWTHRLRRWLVNAIERRRKGLSAEHTGDTTTDFFIRRREKAKLVTKLTFLKMWRKNPIGSWGVTIPFKNDKIRIKIHGWWYDTRTICAHLDRSYMIWFSD